MTWRRTTSGGGGGEAGVSDHGDLTGLADDDHSQYVTDAALTTAIDVHPADTTAAHAASSVAFTPAGTIAATDVQAAIEEVASEAGAVEVGSMFAGMDSRVAFAAQFGADEGYDEEFDGAGVADDVLPTDWSMLNQDASVYRQSFGAGRVDWGGGGDASNLHAAVRTLPATTTFDAFFHTWGASDLATASATYVAAVVLYNSANGDFIYCGLHHSTGTAAPQFFVSHFTDADTQGSTLATGPIQRLASPHVFFRVTKESDTSYDFFGNTDGGCWFTIGANVNVQASLGADPTHIGFALNTVGAGHVGCEWFRLRDLT